MSANTIDLDRITLEDGTVVNEPPVITDASDETKVDSEATETLQGQIKSWAEVAYRIVESGELADNGELTTADSKELRDTYAELPAIPGKSFARNHADEQTRNALSDTSDAEAAFRVAQMWSKISKDQRKDAPKARTARPVTPQASATEVAVDKLTTMKLAVLWFEANPNAGQDESDEVDEGFVESSEDKVEDLTDMMEAYVEWLDREVPEGEEKPEFADEYGDEVDPVVRDAAKIARQKARRARRGGGGGGSTYSGPRRDIGKHIEEAFSQVEVGTFLTVSEIVNLNSSEYGGDKPSSGAVANRLFPPSQSACTVGGIEPGRNEDGRQGATKTA